MTERTGADPSPNAGRVSPRWVEWRKRIDIDEYEARFAQSLAAGDNVHGEADLIASLTAGSVLDAGCGTGRVAIELARRGMDVVGVDLDADMIAAARRKAPDIVWLVDDLARMQLPRRFDLIAMPGNVMLFCRPDDRRLIVHNIAQHLMPGGQLVAGFTLEPAGYSLAQWDEDCSACGLELAQRFATWGADPFVANADYHVSVHHRTDRFTVHDLVAEARVGAPRLSAAELAETLAHDPSVVIIDTRNASDRVERGWIEGSLHVPRTVLEWRVDPASGYSDPAITGFDKRIVVVCDHGYSSSLAAANLRRLGYLNATDLIGGVEAWKDAGLPIETA